ncbi:unnamed protein product [Rhizophagus irregularis]|nr:unnamed protein product [Rhizophagus irregularis]
MGVYLRTYTSGYISGFSPITDEVDYMSKLIFLDVVLSETKSFIIIYRLELMKQIFSQITDKLRGDYGRQNTQESRVKNLRDVCYEPKQLSILRRRYFSKC